MGFFSEVGDFFEDPVKAVTTLITLPYAAATAIGTAAAASVAAPVVAPALAAREQYEAGETAKEIAEKNAALVQKETDERVRIMREENERIESMARARVSASGLSGASSELYINSLVESGRQDIDWLKEVGASEYGLALDQGEAAFQQSRASMWGSIAGTGSGILSSVKSLFG